MGWTVSFVVVFGIAILIPVVWSIIGLATGNTRFWPAVVGTVWAVALMLVTGIGACTKWGDCSDDPGTSGGVVRCARGDQLTGCEPDVWALECRRPVPGCGAISAGSFCPAGERPVFVFCEHMQAGGVKQPWATWSDLSFIAAGLWLLWFLQYFVRTGSRTSGETTSGELQNPMLQIGWLSVAYGMIVIFMGPPSMWFHASMKDWAGWFDSMSVVLWLMFNACYVLYTLCFAMWDRGRGVARTITVLAVWAAFAVVFGAIAVKFPGARLFGYFISGGLWGIAEIIYIFVAWRAKGVVFRRTWWLFVSNFILLAVTMTIWVFFNDGIVSATSCQARESFPGHALFHILASFSTILTFISFASEKRVPPRS
jgi:hypothetical protein